MSTLTVDDIYQVMVLAALQIAKDAGPDLPNVSWEVWQAPEGGYKRSDCGFSVFDENNLTDPHQIRALYLEPMIKDVIELVELDLTPDSKITMALPGPTEPENHPPIKSHFQVPQPPYRVLDFSYLGCLLRLTCIKNRCDHIVYDEDAVQPNHGWILRLEAHYRISKP